MLKSKLYKFLVFNFISTALILSAGISSAQKKTVSSKPKASSVKPRSTKESSEKNKSADELAVPGFNIRTFVISTPGEPFSFLSSLDELKDIMEKMGFEFKFSKSTAYQDPAKMGDPHPGVTIDRYENNGIAVEAMSKNSRKPEGSVQIITIFFPNREEGQYFVQKARRMGFAYTGDLGEEQEFLMNKGGKSYRMRNLRSTAVTLFVDPTFSWDEDIVDPFKDRKPENPGDPYVKKQPLAVPADTVAPAGK